MRRELRCRRRGVRPFHGQVLDAALRAAGRPRGVRGRPTGARRRLRSRRPHGRAGDGDSGRRRWPPSIPPSPSSRLLERATPVSRCGHASAEHLPFPDDTFDAALAQLVVHFMADPVAGLAEMARVTRHDGVVAACVWDHAGRPGPAQPVLACGARARPGRRRRIATGGTREGHLAELFEAAGLRTSRTALISSSSTRPSRSGGSRSPAASVPRAPTWRASTPSGRPSSARRRAAALPSPVRLRSWHRSGLAARGLT